MTERPVNLDKVVEKPGNEQERAELGLSKNQYKKLLKQRKFDETKEEYRRIKREKRKENKAEKRKIQEVEGEEIKGEKKAKKFKVNEQIKTGVTCVVDCAFDDLMNEREIRSMSNQIARMYSAKRLCPYELHLTVESFEKRLKSQFESKVSQYTAWKNIDFHEDNVLENLSEEDKNDYVYLTADTDEIIETLEEGKKYIIGGIVDKNRHKNLCINKAKKLGVKVGRLPIDEYIKINGRQVLATSHVYEILCKWFEYKDWGLAFNAVLPQRKIKGKGGEAEDEDEDDDEVEGGDKKADKEELEETKEIRDVESGDVETKAIETTESSKEESREV